MCDYVCVCVPMASSWLKVTIMYVYIQETKSKSTYQSIYLAM